MDIYNEFIANKKDLTFYAGKDIINRVHAVYDVNGDPWDFTAAGATGMTFKIWEEREGGLLMIDWSYPTNLAWLAHEMTLNAPGSDSAIERGRYYYEWEYQIAGGYSVLISFGEAKLI